GVAVTIKGTRTGQVTDSKGHYSIDVIQENVILVFNYVGYNRKEVKTGKSNHLDVFMAPATDQLNEVVVTGYGVQRKQSVSSAVSTVSPGVSQMLQGRIAGLAITTNGPSANRRAENIRLRGRADDVEDESYKGILENHFINPKNIPLSTFAIDVDAASYSNIRRFINNGSLPPADAVRIEEMINYFHYDLSAPSNADPVAIHTELSSAPWNPQHRLLRIGLKAKQVKTDKLPPSNFVFLIDVSGSMSDYNKLPLVKSSMKLLVDQLRDIDQVAIVTYAGDAGLKLASTSGREKTKIKEAIETLGAGGSTAGGAGIKLAYKIAGENFKKGGNNRIILATDGDFNVGVSSDGDMEQIITKERQSGVSISVLGFGMGNLKDVRWKRSQIKDKVTMPTSITSQKREKPL
ncbi:MAG TPA: von Willebrand factor type A domain-containing protein, partial [Pedobacter sp.]